MVKEIKKVAVIGAGAMGSGIAGNAANAGYDVVLLDKFEGVADKALDRMKAQPIDKPTAVFMDLKNANRITTGTIDDDGDLIADADVIIEAVFERLDVKQETFKMIEENAKPDAIITSNTSTIQIQKLVEGMSDDFKKRFMNTHFFNPPRFMRLLELIDGEDTDPDIFEDLKYFGSRGLGKKVVRCKDTPGFIGNRIGCYMLFRALNEAIEEHVDVEDMDAVLSPGFGFPKMGVFKLADFVGLDILQHVGQNLDDGLAEGDEFRNSYNPEVVAKLVEDGYTGNKGEGGFYRVKKDENGKVVKNNKGKPVKEVLDFASGEYRDAKNSPFFKKNFKKMYKGYDKFFDSDNPAASFAWPILRDTLLYVLNHADEIAYDLQSIDEAMNTGYNWQYGPFELLDKFGVDWFTDKVKAEGFAVPALLEKADGRPFYRRTKEAYQVMNFDGEYENIKREKDVLKLADIKLQSEPILQHNSASLWDIGDGVVCLEFTSPSNAMDPSVLYMINESIKLINASEGKYKGMVVHNEGQHFSVGANLKLIDMFNVVANHPIAKMLGVSGFLNKKLDKFVEDLVFQGQAVYNAMRAAPFPIVGAPTGLNTAKAPVNYAFGGGCEVLLHCDAIQSGPDQVMGLVEAGVGLIPAWGGSTRYLEKTQAAAKMNGPLQAMQPAALAIAKPMDGLAANAQDAKKKLWMEKNDGISMNGEYVLTDAKERVLHMAEDYKPAERPVYNLPGAAGKTAVSMLVDQLYLRHDDPNAGVNHVDVVVCDAIADTLSGGEYITEEDLDAGHVAGDVEAYRDIIRSRPDGRIKVNTTMTLTEDRILQLERDNFYSLYKTPETRKRVAHMANKNVPLREAWPAEEKTPNELRDGFERVRLERRSIDGKPLDGKDGERLEQMAKTTGRILGTAKKLGLF